MENKFSGLMCLSKDTPFPFVWFSMSFMDSVCQLAQAGRSMNDTLTSSKPVRL